MMKGIIAVDVGTASFSAVYARKEGGRIEVIKTLRYPLDLIVSDEFLNPNQHIERRIKEALHKLFADATAVAHHCSVIIISFREPFFEEQVFEKTFERKNPASRISERELSELFLELQREAYDHRAGSEKQKNTTLVRHDLFSSEIHGYRISYPVGYRGATLTLKARFLFISSVLLDYLLNCSSHFFPRCAVVYETNPRVLESALIHIPNIIFPSVILDIGGEVTSVATVPSRTEFNMHEPVFLGLRTLERRIAAQDRSHGESLIRRLIAGTLDDAERVQIDPALHLFVDEWQERVTHSFQKENPILPAAFYLAGRGRDTGIFSQAIQARYPVFPFVIPYDTLYPPSVLENGGDIILRSLLIYHA